MAITCEFIGLCEFFTAPWIGAIGSLAAGIGAVVAAWFSYKMAQAAINRERQREGIEAQSLVAWVDGELRYLKARYRTASLEITRGERQRLEDIVTRGLVQISRSASTALDAAHLRFGLLGKLGPRLARLLSAQKRLVRLAEALPRFKIGQRTSGPDEYWSAVSALRSEIESLIEEIESLLDALERWLDQQTP